METLRDGVPIILPDPFVPARENWARVHEIEVDGRRIRFAICMVGDWTWHFYVPAVAGSPDVLYAREPKFEGYWRARIDDESELPWPEAAPEWLEPGEFLRKLDAVQRKSERLEYRGLSICRICGIVNGHEAFRRDGWEWPAGFRHYIGDHQVRPSAEFEAFVMASEDELANWTFRVEEMSFGVYQAEGRDTQGRTVFRQGTDPEALLEQVRRDARECGDRR